MYQNNFMNILKHFIIYGCAGLFIETLWTGIGSALKGDKNLRCNTYLWMFPIYGMGVFLEPVHEIMRGLLWIYRGFIWAAVIFLIEYITGYVLKLTLGKCPWDYNSGGEILVSVNGLIRLDFLPVWFCVGLLFERLHDFIKIVV